MPLTEQEMRALGEIAKLTGAIAETSGGALDSHRSLEHLVPVLRSIQGECGQVLEYIADTYGDVAPSEFYRLVSRALLERSFELRIEEAQRVAEAAQGGLG